MSNKNVNTSVEKKIDPNRNTVHTFKNKKESKNKLKKEKKSHLGNQPQESQKESKQESQPQEKLADSIDDILKELNDTDLSELSIDKILDLKKKINPYGRTIQGSDKWLSFSVTHISHEYWKKFIITAFIGFLNRMLDEWKVPEGLPVVPVYEYLKDKSKLDTPEFVLKKEDKKLIAEYEFNRKWMEENRIPVKRFLEEMFQFNPDEHVRSAYRPNPADKSRKPINSEAASLATKHLRKTDKEFRAKEQLFNDVKDLENQNIAEEKEGGPNCCVAQNKSGPNSEENPKPKTKTVTMIIKGKDGKKKTVVREVPYSDEEHSEESKKTNGGADPTFAKNVRGTIPPHDIFGRFKYYYNSNLEEIRNAVRDLYCEKPEFEFALNPYAWHDTEDDAKNFRKKHSKEVIAEVFPARSGMWNFYDSFKEQRENIELYGEDTAVIEEMIKQLEKDERLMTDMTLKRKSKVKAVNELEAGPDAESFKKWKKENALIQKFNPTEENGMAADDCPEDAVQVDIWKINPSTMEVAKDRMFTEAEAPTFMQDMQEQIKTDVAKLKQEQYETIESLKK